MLKPPKCLYIKHFCGFSTFKISCFPIRIQSKTHAFSNASIRTSFFEILMRLDAKKLDFGTPWRPAGAQNGARNRPSGAKSLQKSISMEDFLRVLEPICSQGRFRSVPWHHFAWFRMLFAWILMGLHIIFNVQNAHVCQKICRLPISPDTKRIDSKHQEYTDICINMLAWSANKKHRHQSSDR